MKFHVAFVFLAACSFLRGFLCDIVKRPSDATELYGNNHELNCDVEEGDLPGWDEINADGSSVEIFALYERRTSTEKYSNFNISGTFPVYNLKITSIEIEDRGTYQCSTTRFDAERATLSVEAPAVAVNISCDPVPNCPPPDEEEVTSDVTCTCTALGAYPNTLEFEWRGIEPPTTKPSVTSTSTGRTNSLDFTQEATGSISSTSGSITCTLTNYTRQEAERTAEYEYSSPTCVLEVENEDACTSGFATLVCSCTDASPNEISYSFFHGDFTVIPGDPHSNRSENLLFTAGEETTFYCRGCNGFNFGEGSLGTTTVCEKATTTPTMTLMATSTPESDNLGLIIGVVIAAVVVGGGAIGFSVYWFGIRTSSRKRSVKGSNNTGNNFDPPGGADNNTVTASTNETTNSAAPVYGVVNKSTKKKSDNTDGNGVNSKLQSEPDQVEYAAVNKPKPDPQPAPRSSKPPGNNTEPEKMELQYADIDHSNRGRSNEIHQPADAPTEYATVQSVIV